MSSGYVQACVLLASLLRLESTLAYERGTHVSGRDPSRPMRKKTVWRIDSELAHEKLPLEVHLGWLLLL